MWPAYDNEGRQSGFEARHSLTITCTDVHAAGALLSELAGRVGDRLQVESLGLEVGDTGRALAQARAAAYADAVARAQHLAELAGRTAGGGPGDRRRVRRSPQPLADLAGGMREAKAMSIAPGETTIGAALTVTFELVSV